MDLDIFGKDTLDRTRISIGHSQAGKVADTFTSGIHIYTHICRDQNLGIWGAKSIPGEGIQNRNHICINRRGDTWDKGSIVNTAMKNRIDIHIDPNGERKAADTFL